MHMNKEIEEMMLTDHVKKIFEKIFFFFLGGKGLFLFSLSGSILYLFVRIKSDQEIPDRLFSWSVISYCIRHWTTFINHQFNKKCLVLTDAFHVTNEKKKAWLLFQSNFTSFLVYFWVSYEQYLQYALIIVRLYWDKESIYFCLLVFCTG